MNGENNNDFLRPTFFFKSRLFLKFEECIRQKKPLGVYQLDMHTTLKVHEICEISLQHNLPYNLSNLPSIRDGVSYIHVYTL